MKPLGTTASHFGAVKVEVGSFTKQASTGNQDITIATDLTSAAAGSWAVVFWTSNDQGASGTWDPHYYVSLGFAANGGGTVSQYAVSATSDDNQATSATARRTAAKAITMDLNTGAGAYFEAEMGATPFPSSTSMRLNWTTNAVGGQVINYMIISGLTGAKVVRWSTGVSAGNRSATGVGFSPDLVLHAYANSSESLPASSINANFGFGAMNKFGQQWANGVWSEDNQASSDASRWQRTDCCIALPTDAEAVSQRGAYSSMDSDGFTIYFAETAGTQYSVISLCLDGISSKLGAFVGTTGTSQTIESRHDLTPRAAIFSTISQRQTINPFASNIWMLGATDLTTKRLSAISENDNVTPTSVDSVWHSDYELINPSFGSSPQTATMSYGTSSMSATWNAAPGADEFLYAIIGDGAQNVFPVRSDSSIGILSTSTAYSNQKKAVQLSDGTLVVVGDIGTTARFYRSYDGGVTWSYYAADILGWSNGSIAAYVDSGSTERLVAVWKQSGTGGGRTDGVTYGMVGTFSSDRTTLTWDPLGSTPMPEAGAAYDYPDLVVHAESTGGRAHIVRSYKGTTDCYAVYNLGTISAGGSLSSIASQVVIGGDYATSTHTFPSVALDSSTKRVHASWSAGAVGSGKGIRYRTASYSGGAWTWASEVEVSIGYAITTTANHGVKMLWDGTRAVIVGHLTDSAGTPNNYVIVWDSSSFTGFTERASVSYLTTAYESGLYGFGAAIWAATGDVYVFGSAYFTNTSRFVDVAYRKITRSGSTLSIGSRTILDSFTGSTNPAYVNAFPITNGIGFVYTHGAASPYSVKYDRIKL